MTELLTSAGGWPQPLAGGELIGARYRLKRVAGAGGMATVWLAHDERLERPVAIKVISDALAASPTAVARFAREARTHAGIQHPNLVQVYDYSITAARPYLVMEYVNGCTLSERLDRGGFSAAELETLARELLAAVACVHDHGVLHRDIKSANVLLDGEGRARLTDFGLARLEDSSRITRTDEIVGTLRFLAPELLEGRPASRQSDLFALGVVLRGAAGAPASQPQISELIGWLTQQQPEARPADAHAALAMLAPQRHARRERTAALASRHSAGTRGSEPPSISQKPPSIPRRRTAGNLRSRAAALSALASAVTATVVAIVLSTGSGAPALTDHHAATRARTAHVANRGARPAPTVEERLARLASSIRHAGSGR